jgi:hypothetical protein
MGRRREMNSELTPVPQPKDDGTPESTGAEIARIDEQIKLLEFRLQNNAESYEGYGIREQISDLRIKKAELQKSLNSLEGIPTMPEEEPPTTNPTDKEE